MGDAFHFQVNPWKIIAFSRNETIPPKGYKDVYYGLAAPKVKGPLSVEVKLRYRQVEQEIAHELLGAVPHDIDLSATYGMTSMPDMPVVDMVEKTVIINPSK
jgi:hypothetical protein